MNTKFDVGETVWVPAKVRSICIDKSRISYDLYCEYNLNCFVPEDFIEKADNVDEQQT